MTKHVSTGSITIYIFACMFTHIYNLIGLQVRFVLLQCIAVMCNVLQCVAAHYNALQQWTAS